jgi:BMFP domain-containing protein YqiC
MSIEMMNRIRALEAKCEALEARLAIVERAESYEQQEEMVPRRKPGRPRKEQNGEAHG